MGRIYDGDSGTKIELKTGGVDISSAQLLEIVYKKPNGITGKWKATLESSQSASYITKKGDLGNPGRWKIQLRIIMPNWQGHGEIVEFPVHRNLES